MGCIFYYFENHYQLWQRKTIKTNLKLNQGTWLSRTQSELKGYKRRTKAVIIRTIQVIFKRLDCVATLITYPSNTYLTHLQIQSQLYITFWLMIHFNIVFLLQDWHREETILYDVFMMNKHSQIVTKPQLELWPHLALQQDIFFRVDSSYLKIFWAKYL